MSKFNLRTKRRTWSGKIWSPSCSFQFLAHQIWSHTTAPNRVHSSPSSPFRRIAGGETSHSTNSNPEPNDTLSVLIKEPDKFRQGTLRRQVNSWFWNRTTDQTLPISFRISPLHSLLRRQSTTSYFPKKEFKPLMQLCFPDLLPSYGLRIKEATSNPNCPLSK